MKSIKLKEVLQGVLAEKDVSQLVRGYDVIGDVAVIVIPEQLQSFEKEIAETILRVVKKVRVVAKRDGKCCGEFRITPLLPLAGEGEMETMHKEFGLFLHVAPGKYRICVDAIVA